MSRRYGNIAMNPMIRAATLGLCLLFSCVAYAQDKIGVIAPLSGSFARLGSQLVDGVNVAVSGNKQGQDIGVVTADDKCDAAGGAAAAREMVLANATIVIGFLCAESLETALPILSQKGIAVITPGVRDQTLTELRAETPYQVFRIAPSERNAARETGDLLAGIWRSSPFAIIDDGTIFGREIASAVRARLEEKRLKPVFTDTYRPGLDNQNALIGRLKRAGATQVFIGGERDDVVAIGRSAAALNYPLTIVGGETLNAITNGSDLSVGTVMVAPVDPATLESARNAKNAIELAGKAPEGYTVPAYAAAEVAIQLLTTAQAQAASLADLLRKNVFDTAIGPVQFDAHGERIADTLRLQRYDGKQFVQETK